MKERKLVCEECGSNSIQTKGWVDANSYEIRETFECDLQDNWCDNCEKHVYFCDEDKYEGELK